SEDGLLRVARREVVVIVEADLADGAHERHRLDLRADRCGSLLRVVGELTGVMRMHADREPNVGPERFELASLNRLVLVARLEDDERTLDAGLAGTADDRLQIAGKGVIGEVAVGVDQAGSWFRVPGSGFWFRVLATGLLNPATWNLEPGTRDVTELSFPVPVR